MTVMDRTEVAAALERIASYLELRGENPFRVRAFRTATRTVEGLSGDLATAIADGTLAEAKGIGPAILEVITELASTGRSELFESLRHEVPPGLVEMLGIPGLGVARIRQIHTTLGLETLPELEAALGTVPHVLQAHAAGEVRRRTEVVRELVVVVVADVPPEEVFRSISEAVGVREIAGEDERRATLRMGGGTTVQVVVTPPQNVGAVLVQATGSEAHLAALASHATALGFTLAGTALWQGNRFIPTPDEETLYRALDLPWIPPELREDGGEVGRPVPPLVERGDMLGFLHCHTTASDGSNTVAELARACRADGYRWLGITDHSRAASYAGGLGPDDVRRQWDEIDAVNAANPDIRVLKGVESDILPDGSLDYPDEILAGFDFIIGSVHSRFAMSEAEMTARFLRAIENPYLTLIGHPTGRLLLQRQAYPLDLDAVFSAAAAAGVGIEINADPHRLDLDWRVLPAARKAGVMISIGADAHNIAGLANVDYGVAIARKGGLGPEAVLNSRDTDGFLAFARARSR
jgi:DNA polymerase (family 10)